MANKFSDQMGGFISLSLKGENYEKVINLALARGIYIWDIKRNNNLIYLKVRTSGYEAFKSIADENNYEIKLLKRQGMPFWKTVMKRRIGLLGGALIFIAALYLMSSFVWLVQVSGNNKVDQKRILMTAAIHGIYPGAAKWNFSRIEVEEAMLRDMSELSYIQCDVRGVKVHIKVVEKILPDKEITGPCHIVAAQDGVVEEVLVLEGQANVKSGSVVAKGDILISGIVFPPVPYAMAENPVPSGEPYHVRARGKVMARTWYEGYGECSLISEKKVFTEKELNKLYLITPWKNLLLKGWGDNKFIFYEENAKEQVWHSPIGNWGLSSLSIKEQQINTTKYSEKEAVEIAREKALQSLNQKMEANLKVSDSHFVVLSSPSDSIVRIKVSVESIQDISQVHPINAGEISN
ncbi:MAG: sporulation protein YqfD [Firmicutes bacterium HGW-Firmicutes-15]|nr:MAG: sporulation protein YqfD [Firmicutes bacterium HGW-Firmicutes-15]